MPHSFRTTTRHAVLLILACAFAPVRAQDDAARVAAALQRDAYPEVAQVWLGTVLGYAGTMAGPLGRTLPAWPTQRAVRDSVASALRTEAHPDLLAEALVYLDGPGWARINDRVRLNAPVLGDAVGQAQMDMWTPPGKKGAQSRTERAARYHEATGASGRSLGLLQRAARTFVVSMPDLRDDTIEQGRSIEDAAADLFGPLGTEAAEVQNALSRTALAGVAPRDMDDAIAFFESPAGLYVTRARDTGTAEALQSTVVRWVHALTGGRSTGFLDG